MSAATLILIAVLVGSIGFLAVMGIGLAKEGKRLFLAGKEFADQVAPVIDEVSAGADRASRHAAELGERAAAIRS